MAVDLAGRGIDESDAANLRARLATFAEDWERPEMGAYDALYKRGDVVLVLFQRGPTRYRRWY